MSLSLFELYVTMATFVLSSHRAGTRPLSTLTSLTPSSITSCYSLLRTKFLSLLFPLSRVWHPAIVDDTIFILQHLSLKYSKAKIFLAGYSAGSNIVHNTLHTLLNSDNNKIKISGVFCCCVNWCYSTTLKRLEKSGSISGFFYSSLLSHQVKVSHLNVITSSNSLSLF